MGIRKDWARCLNCGARRLVEHKEWIRRSRPRCLACGGAIEISSTAAKEHAEHTDAKKADQDKRDIQTGRK